MKHIDAAEMFLHAREALEPTAARRLEEHAAECAECGEQLRTLQWMRRHAAERGPALFAGHIAAEELVGYADASTALPERTRREIDRHLELCSDCEDDLRRLGELKLTLDAARGPRTSRGTGSRRLARALPVWAYAAMFILAIPATYGVLQWTRQGPTVLQAPGQTIELIAREERGGAEELAIDLRAGLPIRLTLEVPILEGGAARYDGRLLSSEGETAWAQRGMRSIDEFGSFVVLLPEEALREGHYRLIVEEYVGGSVVQEFVFPFAVVD